MNNIMKILREYDFEWFPKDIACVDEKEHTLIKLKPSETKEGLEKCFICTRCLQKFILRIKGEPLKEVKKEKWKPKQIQ